MTGIRKELVGEGKMFEIKEKRIVVGLVKGGRRFGK